MGRHMTRKPPTRQPVVTERPIPENLYPQFLSWDSVDGEPIDRVLSCLRDLLEMELHEFFNSSSKEFFRLPPAALLCGRPEPNATPTDKQAVLLRLPKQVRLDMVAGSATRFRALVFEELRNLGGEAGHIDMRKLLSIRRTRDRLLELSTAAFGDSKGSPAFNLINGLRSVSEELDSAITRARDEAEQRFESPPDTAGVSAIAAAAQRLR